MLYQVVSPYWTAIDFPFQTLEAAKYHFLWLRCNDMRGYKELYLVEFEGKSPHKNNSKILERGGKIN